MCEGVRISCLCVPDFLGSLLNSFSSFFLLLLLLLLLLHFKRIPLRISEVVTESSPIILGLDKLLVDRGTTAVQGRKIWPQAHFFDQSEHAYFSLNQESVTL